MIDGLFAGIPTKPGLPDRPAGVVARRRHDEGAGGQCPLPDGLVGLRDLLDVGAERHGDDANVVRQRPVDAREDLPVGPAAPVVEHLPDEDRRLRGYAVAAAAVRRIGRAA
jgi:hypothetical protein